MQKSLSVRTHICPHCGYVANRDVNAAKVIEQFCTAGYAGTNACGDGGAGSDAIGVKLPSLKQELNCVHNWTQER